MESHKIRMVLSLLGASVLPLSVAWAYLFYSHVENWDTGTSDFVALGVCLVVGVVSLVALPLKFWWRVVLCVLYLPVATVTLGMFSITFVCVSFGRCP